MKDVLGLALSDYYHHTSIGKLWVHNKYGPKEEMPVDVYFRRPDEMPEVEWVALQHCKDRILDIGAGAGSHSLALQQMGLDVTALDISPKAVTIMEHRGLKKVICGDFFEFSPGASGPFDTLLLMMNGIGLSGTLDGLRKFLDHARLLILPGGRLIFDSSDVSYMHPGRKIPQMKDYYGEILYQYEYKKQRSDWFKWLFIDKVTLSEIASAAGWRTTILFEDGWDQFLVKCELQ